MKPGCGSISATRRSWRIGKGSWTWSDHCGPRRGLPTPTPPRGATTRKWPPRGAILIPRPLAEVAYSALKTPDSNLDCSRLSLEQGDYHLSDKVVLGKGLCPLKS